MAADFDPADKEAWYFGQLGRRVTDQLLMNETEGGVFLVRDSASMAGDYVLCVREGNRVAHYIINHAKSTDAAAGSSSGDGGGTVLKIGDKQFASLTDLLRFYKMHYLDTTPLIRPAQKILARVQAVFNFDGKDPDDLPFRKGEIMYILARDEEQWWTARNQQGDIGSVPLPYLKVLEEATRPEGLLPADLFQTDAAESSLNASSNGNGAAINTSKASPTGAAQGGGVGKPVAPVQNGSSGSHVPAKDAAASAIEKETSNT